MHRRYRTGTFQTRVLTSLFSLLALEGLLTVAILQVTVLVGENSGSHGGEYEVYFLHHQGDDL
jgi:hypothetical protein